MSKPKFKIEFIRLLWIRIDSKNQRKPLDFAQIDAYVRDGVPVLNVCWDGKDYWLCDNFEAYHAACRLKLSAVKVKTTRNASRHVPRGQYRNGKLEAYVRCRKKRLARDPAFAQRQRELSNERKKRWRAKKKLQMVHVNGTMS